MTMTLNLLFEILGYFPLWQTIVVSVVLFWVLGYFGANILVFSLFAASLLFLSGVSSIVAWGCLLVFYVLFGIPIIRQYLISTPVMNLMIALKLLPVISPTEQEAIDAGTVWVDKELFSGKPDFKNILAENYPRLTAEERAFIDGPVEKVCRMLSEWEVQRTRDLPIEVWDFLKNERFFGMIIKKEYGGLDFSAFAHSAVISKLASRSITAAITVMVPNSLGPGELLTHYGTQAQKDRYLNALAMGEEIPCFALTEPTAGSDAGAIAAHGEVFKGDDGELYVRLNWNKRWITLAAIATVIGVAFKLNDPENLLGKGTHLGITCALVDAKLAGVKLGRRHDPLSVPFYNCPTNGEDVVISVNDIIGGPEGAGRGWRMLMESLSAGRGISLPSNSIGGAKMVTRGVGAFAYLRQQFGMSIGKFEGVQEALARIGGMTYALDAMRTFTCGAIDNGQKPSVITAIAKYHSTEMFRQIINDGMDIMGGAAISDGPRNILAAPYKATPIGITVEGANILTRTLIIFGQGAIRCHPFVLDEVDAINTRNTKKFDRSFFGHVAHVITTVFQAKFLTFTKGFFAKSPVNGPTAKYYKKLRWVSSVYAMMSDVALGTLGGDLKRKEMLTGRYADVLSWMYILTATLRRYEADGRKKEDLAYVHYAFAYGLNQIQQAALGICSNLPALKPWKCLVKLFPFGQAPSDSLSTEIATLMQRDSEQRDRMTADIYLSADSDDNLGRLDQAFKAVQKTEVLAVKIKKAIRAKTLKKGSLLSILDEAVKQGVLSSAEAKQVTDAEAKRYDAILVDEFTLEEYINRSK